MIGVCMARKKRRSIKMSTEDSPRTHRRHCTCVNGYVVWGQMMGFRAITEVVEWYNAQWVESCESLTYT